MPTTHSIKTTGTTEEFKELSLLPKNYNGKLGEGLVKTWANKNNNPILLKDIFGKTIDLTSPTFYSFSFETTDNEVKQTRQMFLVIKPTIQIFIPGSKNNTNWCLAIDRGNGIADFIYPIDTQQTPPAKDFNAVYWMGLKSYYGTPTETVDFDILHIFTPINDTCVLNEQKIKLMAQLAQTAHIDRNDQSFVKNWQRYNTHDFSAIKRPYEKRYLNRLDLICPTEKLLTCYRIEDQDDYKINLIIQNQDLNDEQFKQMLSTTIKKRFMKLNANTAFYKKLSDSLSDDDITIFNEWFSTHDHPLRQWKEITQLIPQVIWNEENNVAFCRLFNNIMTPLRSLDKAQKQRTHYKIDHALSSRSDAITSQDLKRLAYEVAIWTIMAIVVFSCAALLAVTMLSFTHPLVLTLFIATLVPSFMSLACILRLITTYCINLYPSVADDYALKKNNLDAQEKLSELEQNAEKTIRCVMQEIKQYIKSVPKYDSTDLLITDDSPVLGNVPKVF